MLQSGPPHNIIALLQFLLFIELQTGTGFCSWKSSAVEAVGAGTLRNIANNYIVAWTGDRCGRGSYEFTTEKGVHRI